MINHIQFLRAFSVLIVFFYHFKIDYFYKGYLGVDIFFIISGYVITSKIFLDIEKYNKINLFNFYLNRAKRIVPAIFFIFSLTLLVIIFFQPSDLLTKNIKVYLSSLLGFSNLYYLNFEGDYFDTIFSDPLNHSWSLGVEIQFYLFFPLLLLLIKNFKISFNKTLVIFSILILTGVYLNLYFYSFPSNIFYNPIFRIWEFLMGSLTFMISKKYKYKNSKLSNFAFFIVLLFLFYDPLNNKVYTSFLILFFTCFFLNFYKTNIYSKLFFENKFFIFLGNISYSFYLWHLPIIYFSDLYFLPNIFTLPVIFLLSIVLSQFTYKYVEQKFRYKKINFKFSKKFFFISSLICFIFIGTLSSLVANIHLKKHLKNKIYDINYLEINKNFVKRTSQYSFEFGGTKVYRDCISTLKNQILSKENLNLKCQKNSHNKNRIFFIHGDSLTANFVPVLNSLKIKDSLYFEHYDVAILDLDIDKLNNLLNYYSEVVFVTNVEDPYTLEILLEARKNFNNKIKILVLGSPPHIDLKITPLKCFIQNRDCEYIRSDDIKLRNLQKLNDSIKTISKNDQNFYFFDPYNSICPNDKCLVYDSQSDLLTHRDDNHLTTEGSLLILQEFQKYIFEKFR